MEKVRGFVLHSVDYSKKDTIKISEDVCVSSSIDVITDIAYGVGPKQNLIALGYASWGPRQLEQELISNNWMVANSSEDLVFRTKDEDKWQKAIDSLGFDVSVLCNFSGRA